MIFNPISIHSNIAKKRRSTTNFILNKQNQELIDSKSDRLLHYKFQDVKTFRCCNQTTDLFDIVSSTECSEFVIKICKICETKYNEETIFGHQDLGFPIIKTFKYNK